MTDGKKVIIINKKEHGLKLVTKRSTYFGRFSESRRRCDCGSQRGMEWTWEGGSNEPKALVMPDGISARYQGKAYDSTCAEWVHFYVPN